MDLYGLLRGDVVIIAANVVSLTLLSCIIYFKLHERKASHETGPDQSAGSRTAGIDLNLL